MRVLAKASGGDLERLPGAGHLAVPSKLRSILEASVAAACGSPWFTSVVVGGLANCRSQPRISFASAWADKGARVYSLRQPPIEIVIPTRLGVRIRVDSDETEVEDFEWHE